MQFPVPQFTEVEDKIIGPLTLKQFGILFVTGIIVFAGFSATKSLIVLIVLALLFGIPGLALAFAPFNGRPLYGTISLLIKFVLAPKVLTFHKEVSTLTTTKELKDMQVEEVKKVEVKPVENTKTHLKEIEELLRKTALEEREIASKIK